MSTTRALPRLRAAVLAGLVVGAGLAVAQQVPPPAGDHPPEADHQFIPEAEWAKLAPGAAGRKFYVEGRWYESWRDRVSLFEAPASKDLLVIDITGRLHADLAQNKDSNGMPIPPRTTNVRVYGAAEVRGQQVVLVVSRVVAIEDDVVRLRRLAAALAPGDIAGLERLAAEALALATRYKDDRLRALAGEFTKTANDRRSSLLAPDDIAGALALAATKERASDRAGAIELYGRVETSEAATPAQREEARTHLQGPLQAIRSGNRWMPYEDFKVGQRFVLRARRWVRRELAELDDVEADERKAAAGQVVIVRGNPVQSGRDAEQGKLSRGQSMEEVTLAIGLPQSVNHKIAPDFDGRPADWAQWIYADGRRVYFLGPVEAPRPGEPVPTGEVLRVKAASDAWPSK